eukprot:3725925-Prymnesium_polylepis.1
METEVAAEAAADAAAVVLPEEAIECAVEHAMMDPAGAKRGGAAGGRLAALPRLFSILVQMANVWDDDDDAGYDSAGGLQTAWAALPSIRRRWHGLLAQPEVETGSVEFLLAGVIDHLVRALAVTRIDRGGWL